MLAFALGIAALACLVEQTPCRGSHRRRCGGRRARHHGALVWRRRSPLAILWDTPRRTAGLVAAVGATAAVGIALTLTTLSARLVAMDAAWIQAIGDRSYSVLGRSGRSPPGFSTSAMPSLLGAIYGDDAQSVFPSRARPASSPVSLALVAAVSRLRAADRAAHRAGGATPGQPRLLAARRSRGVLSRVVARE